jgi:serine protease AprX
MRKTSIPLGICLALVGSAAAANAQAVIIKCERPCATIVDAVERNGGSVTYRYRYVDAIAAELTPRALIAVRQLAEPGALRKDHVVQLPTSVTNRIGTPAATQVSVESSEPLGEQDIVARAVANPNAYTVNNQAMNVGPLHAGNILGQGMKVAVIDSGIRPGFPHLSLDNSVIGGENLVGDALGFSNSANNGHGTFVAGMISSNVAFVVAGALRTSVTTHCPSCVIPINATQSVLPVIGSAPSSSIYALRVFGATGGAPESRIIAAMERVLTLRENFDSGMAETQNVDGSFNALNIRVCNMSLGGPTLYSGRDIQSQLTNAFLERDVVLVISAGNAGPAGTTIGTPGTGFGALTVGASSSAIHERILRDLQFGPGMGVQYRPFAAVQTAFFSSRGPTADGRVDPEIVANGFASFGQGFGAAPGSLDLGSGTSFSSPSVAGVATLLRQAVPTATARQVRNALILSANAGAIGDGSGPFDRGAGHVNGAAALALLQDGSAPDTPGIVGHVQDTVRENLRRGVDLRTFAGTVTRSVSNLLPGQRFETYYRVPKDTAAVTVTLSNVTPGATQNALFGDDILLTVHSAKTSAIGEGDYKVFEFTTGGTFTIPNPDYGLLRVTVNGDWTNASPIGATISIATTRTPTPGKTADNYIEEGQQIAVPFNVAAGVALLTAQLEWDVDWSTYPTNDLDVILIPPTGPAIVAGATLNAPELVRLENPVAGEWLAIVDAFTIFSQVEKFTLRVAADGKVLKAKSVK